MFFPQQTSSVPPPPPAPAASPSSHPTPAAPPTVSSSATPGSSTTPAPPQPPPPPPVPAHMSSHALPRPPPPPAVPPSPMAADDAIEAASLASSTSAASTTYPLIQKSPYGKMVVVRADLPLPSPEEEVRTTFANVKDWALLAEDVDTLSLYTQLRPVIQQGPQCGLVALSMASQVFPQTVEVTQLLQAAKERGMTCHGEMFSAEAVKRLAEQTVGGMEATVRRDVLCDARTFVHTLMAGDLILVPYDAERNYFPGVRGGHKAHWGVVCGCLIQSEALNVHVGGASRVDPRVDHLWHLRPRSRAGGGRCSRSRDGSVTPTIPSSPRSSRKPLNTPDLPASDQPRERSASRGSELDLWSVASGSRVGTPMLPEFLHEDLRVVALWRQGKSRKLVAAPLEALCESNDQLHDYPPARTPQEAQYVVGSVQEGLAGQVVVLHKTKSTLSDLVGFLQERAPC